MLNVNMTKSGRAVACHYTQTAVTFKFCVIHMSDTFALILYNQTSYT